jgi:hypothetical protein
MAPVARAWSGRRNDSPIYGKTIGRLGCRCHRDIPVPIPVHGATTAGARSTGSTDCYGSGRRARSKTNRSRFALIGRRQIHGRANDFASGRSASPRRRARLGLLRLPPSPAQSPRNKTRRPPRKSKHSDVVLARNPRHPGRSQVVAPNLYRIRRTSHAARHRNRRSFLPRLENLGKNRCGRVTGTGRNYSLVGEGTATAKRLARCDRPMLPPKSAVSPRLRVSGRSEIFVRQAQRGCWRPMRVPRVSIPGSTPSPLFPTPPHSHVAIRTLASFPLLSSPPHTCHGGFMSRAKTFHESSREAS